MVALLTPERAAMGSTLIPITPCSAITSSVAWSTTSWSRRGRGDTSGGGELDADVVEQAHVAEPDRGQDAHRAREVVEGRHRRAVHHGEVLDRSGVPDAGGEGLLERCRGRRAGFRRVADGAECSVQHGCDIALLGCELRVATRH